MAREVKIELGTIAPVTPEENEFTLQPSAEEQREEPIDERIRSRPLASLRVAG